MRRIHRRRGYDSILSILIVVGLVIFGFQAFSTTKELFVQLLIIAFFIFSLTFFSTIFALSFFIIPIEEPADLIATFTRILLFALRSHGPILFVKFGKPEVMHAGFKKDLPGLVILDSASAAIISRTTSYHRAAGPGICFTQRNESISNTINLSLHKKWVGPLENEEPFRLQGNKESQEEYQSRMKRAAETTAFTADGKKITASFLLMFKLEAAPGEGTSPYGFNPISVKKALLSQPISSQGNRTTSLVDWSDLPGILIADLWKEYIGHYRLNEIFSIDKDTLGEFLKRLQDSMTETNLQETGITTGFEAIIQLKNQRGIALREIHLMQVFPDEDAIEEIRSHALNEHPTTDGEYLDKKEKQEKTAMMTSGQQVTGNMLAGIINDLSEKGNLTYEALNKEINQHLKFLSLDEDI